MKQVSVIVTCYNHEKYIRQCLTSIFKQTYPAIRLTVIDDGSTDGSGAIIQEVLGRSPFSNTVFLQQENAGVCAVRNRGLAETTGDFVLFIDSDDYLPQDYVQRLVEKAEATAADIVYGNLWDFNEDKFYVESHAFELTSFLQSNYINNSSLLRRSVIKETRYDMALNRQFLEDWDFLMTLILENGAKPVYAPEVKLNYRILPDSISRRDGHTQRKSFYEVYFYLLKKHVPKWKDEIFTALENNTMLLEDRLVELTDHLEEVTDYVKSLEGKLTGDPANQSPEAEIKRLNTEIQRLQGEQVALLHSRSYRMGNAIIRPAKYALKVVRNPRAAKPLVKRVLSRMKRTARKIPSPMRYLYRPYRSLARSKNNYTDPKRQLIYVIYEEQPQLQTYKLLFLEGLADFCADILIVVNGELPQSDIDKLATYGQVRCRENSGYDTAAFREGILFLGKEQLATYDQLLLVNDTNVGPFGNLQQVFSKMAARRLDFWGISYGEEQSDITGYNKYGYIPLHLQSYFLAIEHSLLDSPAFWTYWEQLTDTNSREKAIGRHETVFTRHFTDLGFKADALLTHNADSAMYIHPLTMLKKGIPLVKYSAFANYSNEKFLWQGLKRQTEVPDLIAYLDQQTNYPMAVIHQIQEDIRKKDQEQYILIIDGVENQIPQCTRYRVLNKAEQLRSLGYPVKVVDNSKFRLADAERAFLIIVYRCGYREVLGQMVTLAKQFGKGVLYDIDDLVIDTKYTDQLAYTQGLSVGAKGDYDAGVMSYGKMLELCDGAVTTTARLKTELSNYRPFVLMNRNLASKELVDISRQFMKDYSTPEESTVKIGYFSGSITHNENFELVKEALIRLMNRYLHVELHIVGYLELPQDLQPFKKRIIIHDYVEWHQLPELISRVDINLAPLTDTIFNQAKSEIKWLEAALVKVPTVASRLGSFEEMIKDGQTGLLASDDEWEESLELLIGSRELRQRLAEAAAEEVERQCVTSRHHDELTAYVKKWLASDEKGAVQ